MAEGKKGWGKTVAGWFVEFEDEAPAGAAPAAGKAPAGKPAAPPPASDDATDDIIRRYAGGGGGAKGAKPAPAAAKPDASPARSPSGEAPPDFGGGAAMPAASGGGSSSSAPGVDAAGNVDFASVFKAAGITEAESDRVNRTLGLLSQLPAETPQPVKKQIVEASLNSFGVPIESIIESAVAEIEALHGCIQAGQQQTASLMEQSQARIEQLQKQMAEVQQVILARQAEQRALEQQARAQGLKVQQILEFFGQELVGKVVKESPRLHEPEKS